MHDLVIITIAISYELLVEIEELLSPGVLKVQNSCVPGVMLNYSTSVFFHINQHMPIHVACIYCNIFKNITAVFPYKCMI